MRTRLGHPPADEQSQEAQVAFVEFADAGARRPPWMQRPQSGHQSVRVTPSKTPLRFTREEQNATPATRRLRSRRRRARRARDPGDCGGGGGRRRRPRRRQRLRRGGGGDGVRDGETLRLCGGVGRRQRGARDRRRRVTRREGDPGGANASGRRRNEKKSKGGEAEEGGTRIESPRRLARARTRSAGALGGVTSRGDRDRVRPNTMVMTPSGDRRPRRSIDDERS